MSDANGFTIEVVSGDNSQVALARPTLHQTKLKNPALVYLASLDSRMSQRTMASYMNIIVELITKRTGPDRISFMDFDWSQLRRQHIMAIINQLKQSNRAPATINGYLHCLKGIAREAWALDYMTDSEHRHIESIKSTRGSRKRRSLTSNDESLYQIFRVCALDKSEIGVRDLAMMLSMAGLGLRRTELVMLNFEDVDFQAKTVLVLGKGNKQRELIMPANVRNALFEWVDQVRGYEPGALFTRINRGGRVTDSRLTSQAVLYLLEKRCDEAGLNAVTPHQLRRMFATMLLQDGTDLITVRDAMGHASVETTQTYILENKDLERQAMQRLDERLQYQN